MMWTIRLVRTLVLPGGKGRKGELWLVAEKSLDVDRDTACTDLLLDQLEFESEGKDQR